jgi:Zn-dependent M28 family amino/carboxypeptidase
MPRSATACRAARPARHRPRPRRRQCRRRSRPWARGGTAAIDLNQDGTRYFDYHHTPDDTLDKVDPAQLRQNVAAWTAMLAAVADAPEAIAPVEVAP